MNSPVQSNEVKTKNITSGLVFGWIFGVIFLIAGVTNFTSDLVTAILFIIAALIALPPVSKVLKEKAHISLSKSLKVVTIIILVIVAVSMTGTDTENPVSASASGTTTAAPEKRVPIKISANKLSEEYKANEVAADAKYKGQLLEVSGTIHDIGKDILDTPYVTFKIGEYSFDGIQCMFTKADEPKIATLTKGYPITLQGEISGKVLNVILDECKIVE